MLPGTFPFSAGLLPEILQFSRSAYNTGFVSSGSKTINIASLMPYVSSGDNLRLDALWWQGSWCLWWYPRVRFFFKYGTAYSSGDIAGYYDKSHYIGFTYSGGTTATVYHFYSGKSTDFPNAEVSIDRLEWRATNTETANYYTKSLPA